MWLHAAAVLWVLRLQMDGNGGDHGLAAFQGHSAAEAGQAHAVPVAAGQL